MYKYFGKRIIDFLSSSLILLVTSPIIIVATLALTLSLKESPFFTQKRPGKEEKIFTVIKFKSMKTAYDSRGKLLPDEQRITKIGRFLRRTSIDELPQLFNVLAGSMSLVGPRPLLISYLPYYTEYEKKRHNVKPGITGLAQINGRNYLVWKDRLSKDVEYVENLSFLNDLRIILKTIYLVLKRKDVAEDTNAIEGNLAQLRKNINITNKDH